MSDELQKIKVNLASLNEIIAEMVFVVGKDQGFNEMVRNTLRDHSWSLGFEFQGQRAPVAWERS